MTLFRSGLGIALYLAQDHPDIQHTVRVLSSFMGSPTKKALVWLKHLCLYLKNSEDYGLFIQKARQGRHCLTFGVFLMACRTGRIEQTMSLRSKAQ